jgi:hypothetical protein
MSDATALDDALGRLRDANPEPGDVEKLTAATLDRRDNPHTFGSIFVRDFGGRIICQLCGLISQDHYAGPSKHPAVLHVDWHNAMHRAGVILG